MKSVLLTGASGDIGSTFYKWAHDSYRFVLTDLVVPDYDIDPKDVFEPADLSDPGAAARLLDSIDIVVHLAAEADEFKGFEDILPANIVGTSYMLEAAAYAGVARFVFASSIHAVQGYPDDYSVREDDLVKPINVYGASKCYGEALCAVYASQRDLSIVALRIGDFEDYGSDKIRDAFDCSSWIGPKDMTQLLVRAIETEDIDFFIAHGVSNNRIKRLDLTETRRVLGYAPEDDGYQVFPEAAATVHVTGSD